MVALENLGLPYYFMYTRNKLKIYILCVTTYKQNLMAQVTLLIRVTWGTCIKSIFGSW